MTANTKLNRWLQACKEHGIRTICITNGAIVYYGADDEPKPYSATIRSLYQLMIPEELPGALHNHGFVFEHRLGLAAYIDVKHRWLLLKDVMIGDEKRYTEKMPKEGLIDDIEQQEGEDLALWSQRLADNNIILLYNDRWRYLKDGKPYEDPILDDLVPPEKRAAAVYKTAGWYPEVVDVYLNYTTREMTWWGNTKPFNGPEYDPFQDILAMMEENQLGLQVYFDEDEMDADWQIDGRMLNYRVDGVEKEAEFSQDYHNTGLWALHGDLAKALYDAASGDLADGDFYFWPHLGVYDGAHFEESQIFDFSTIRWRP